MKLKKIILSSAALALGLFLGLSVVENAHAMTQKDLGGKVFLVDVSGDENYELNDKGAQNEMVLIMFNKKGNRYVKNFVSTDGQGNITGFPRFGKENKNEYNKAISSKKGYYAIDMDMPVKGNDYRVKGNKIKMGDSWAIISEDAPNSYTINWQEGDSGAEIVSRYAKNGEVTASGPSHTQHLTLANQQYKFKW